MISPRTFFRRLLTPQVPGAAWETCSDADLIQAAVLKNRAGQEAFVEIVRRYESAVCSVAYGMLGNFTLVEDVAQEAFLRAWQRLGTLREAEKLKAWLVRIAHDCAVDAIRKSDRTSKLAVQQAGEMLESTEGPDQTLAAAEEEAMVWSALEQLPEMLRLPLVLFYREGQSVSAVAASLDVSEDAVKQRLHRGREALREQVSRRIEGVLGKWQPSAVVIVAVAIGIGLIAAPATLAAGAMAGSVVSAAASSSATTTSTATTFSTAMTASSYLVAAVTLIAFIPIGWKARQPDHASSAVPTKAVAKPAKPKNAFEAFPDSELLRQWQRLHTEHGTDAAAMVKIYASIADLKDAFQRRSLRSALLAEWAALDPANGILFLFEKNKGDQAANLLSEWLKLDANAAATFLATLPKNHQWLAFDALEDIAKAAPEAALALMIHLPGPRTEVHFEVRNAFASIAEKNLQQALDAVSGLAEANRGPAQEGIAQGWAKHDADAALTWAKALPAGQVREGALCQAVLGLAHVHPAAAMDRLHEAPTAGQEQQMFNGELGQQVLKLFAAKDFPATLAWLEKNPSKVGDRTFMGLTDAVQAKLDENPQAFCQFLVAQPELMKARLLGPFKQVLLNDGYAYKDTVWAWIKTLPPGEFATAITGQMISSAAWIEPSQAMLWLHEFPLDQPLPRFISGNLQQLLGETRNPQQLEGLLAQAPEAFRGELRAQALLADLPGTLSSGETAYWQSHLSNLPKDRQPDAVSILVGCLAEADPQAAQTWVTRLTDQSQSIAAHEQMSIAWARQDVEASSQWVRDLPQSPQRDAAAYGLVMSIAGPDPEAAWAWACDMREATPKRFQALQHALKGWQNKERDIVNKLLSTSTNPQELEVLKTALPTGPAIRPVEAQIFPAQ